MSDDTLGWMPGCLTLRAWRPGFELLADATAISVISSDGFDVFEVEALGDFTELIAQQKKTIRSEENLIARQRQTIADEQAELEGDRDEELSGKED